MAPTKNWSWFTTGFYAQAFGRRNQQRTIRSNAKDWRRYLAATRRRSGESRQVVREPQEGAWPAGVRKRKAALVGGGCRALLHFEQGEML